MGVCVISMRTPHTTCVQMPKKAKEDARKSDPLELGLSAAVNGLVWVLETQPRFSGRTVSILTCSAASPFPTVELMQMLHRERCRPEAFHKNHCRCSEGVGTFVSQLGVDRTPLW